MVFSIVFAGAFYWFYTFTTEKTISRLRADMKSTLIGAANGIDVKELLALYINGKPNAHGFSDDPRFQHQLAWFEMVHSIEPRAWLYTYTFGKAKYNRRIGEPAVAPDQLEIIYLVDLWAKYNPAKSVRFLEAGVPGQVTEQVIQRGAIAETPDIYTDKWGTWLSAFAPLKDSSGKVVAILGVDIQADYVLKVQQEIRDKVLLSFVSTYGVLFILVYILSGVLTKHLTELTESAKRITIGNYNQVLSFAKQRWFPDEMNTLAQVFEVMIDSIRTREQQIREGKQAEDEIRRALEEEKELSELKSRFVSIASHEFRTPLTAIRTATEILEQYGDVASEEKKREYFRRIRTAIQNINQLMEDVLTIGKAEAGKLEFNPIRLNLEEFCQEILDEIKLGVGSNHTITFTCEGNCQHACLDAKLLRSILTNLLSNAIKYSPQGSIVRFALFCSQKNVYFEIQDQGIGIPPDDQPKLFELFHRARNADTVRGTGLGLAIVKQCVELHQGQITFTSQENIGTTFRVEFPLYREPILQAE
ncbi:MAG: sensor histidine kinase [Leptolyngbyaceae cyanobacterium HOT.MB2.61]|nr:sensor histidine kinase [Leptolyngbyaceae cyanobacterium HOT.MB2.61]